MKRYTLAAVTALLVLAPWHEAVRAEPPAYTVENLGSFGGVVPSISGVNASGQVVGNVNGAMAVRYTNGSGWQALPGVDTGGFSFATGINASGDVVGYRFTPTGLLRAFRYRDGYPIEDLDPLTGGSMTVGMGINDAGDVVGYSDSTGGAFLGFRASPGLPAAALPALGGGFSFACGINTAGQVAGASQLATGGQHATRVDFGSAVAQVIVPLNGTVGTAEVCAIDADGTVAGQSTTGAATHAFRNVNGAGSEDLDTFGSVESNVESIAAGLSVGWYKFGGSYHAFAHRDADGSFDLNTRIDDPSWVLVLGKGVNASGVIVGEGTYMGAPAVFRLTPVAAAADTTPPVISSVTASPSSIFPPNGSFVPVLVSVNATDDSGDAPICSISSITAPGAPAGDASITAPLAGSVKAVGGRTYTVAVSCADAAGNASFSSVGVLVVADTTAPVISSVSASPATVWPPDGHMQAVTVSVSATDDLDAAPACTLTGVTGGGAGDSSFTPPFAASVKAVGGTTYTLSVRCQDAAGNQSNAATTVVVPADTTAPLITALSASPSLIWPANGKLVPVLLSVSAEDDVDASPTCSVSGVSGGPAFDYVVTGPLSVKLRAVKNANYLVAVTCTDDAGNSSVAAVSVSVDKDGRTKRCD